MNDQDNQNNTVGQTPSPQTPTDTWPPAASQSIANPNPVTNEPPQPTWPAPTATNVVPPTPNSMPSSNSDPLNAMSPSAGQPAMSFPPIETPTPPANNPTFDNTSSPLATPPAWPSDQQTMPQTAPITPPAWPADNNPTNPQPTPNMEASAFGQPTFPTDATPAPTFGDASTPPPASNQNLLDALYATSPTTTSPAQPNPLNNDISAGHPIETTLTPTPQPIPEANPMPTFQSQPTQPAMPSPEMPTGGSDFNPIAQNPIPDQNSPLQNPTMAPMDSAPTDLSHLIGNTEAPPPADLYTPPVVPDNLAVPTPAPTAVPESIDTSSHSGNKNKLLLIIVGTVLLLAVIAVCAYFILGIGRTEETTAVPAVQEQTPLTNPPVVSTPNPTNEATVSGGFGSINPTATPSASKAPTAADLLRQRQNGASGSSAVVGNPN